MTTRITKAKELLQEGKSLYKKPKEEEQISNIFNKKESKKRIDEILYQLSTHMGPSPRSLSSLRYDTLMMTSLNGMTIHMFANKIPISTFNKESFTFDVGKTRYIVEVFTTDTIAGCIRNIIMKEKNLFRYKTINKLSYNQLQSVGLLEGLEQIVRPEYLRRTMFGDLLHQELHQYQRSGFFARR